MLNIQPAQQSSSSSSGVGLSSSSAALGRGQQSGGSGSSSSQSVPMGINNNSSSSLIQSTDPQPTRHFSTSPTNQFDQYMKKKKRVFNNEKYFIIESLTVSTGKDQKTPISNYSKIYFVNDFAANFAKHQHILPDEMVKKILSYISFPLGNYMKRIFHQNNRQFVYDYNQLVNESKNDTRNLIPDFMKENITLIQTWRDITRLIYGKRASRNSTTNSCAALNSDGDGDSMMMDCTSGGGDDQQANSNNSNSNSIGGNNVTPFGNPFLLWSNLDCGIQSCYEYDQELPLNTKQIRTVLFCFSNLTGFDFSGNTSFNNRSLKNLIQRNQKLESLNLKVTRIDYDGLVHLLDKQSGANETLRELKLTKTLLRTSIPIDFYGKLKALRSLELVNHQLKDSDVVKIIQSQRNFTHLNLSGSSIPMEIVNLKSLTSLVLEDCTVSAEIAKTIVEKLDQLKLLDFSKINGLTPDVFENIDRMDSLGHLKLAGTDIGDDVLKPISKSSSITFLDLESTKITTKGIKILLEGQTATTLTCLSVRNCNITTQIAKNEFPTFIKIFKL